MITVVAETGEISVPEWVTDIDAFRRWVDEPDFPEEAIFGGCATNKQGHPEYTLHVK